MHLVGGRVPDGARLLHRLRVQQPRLHVPQGSHEDHRFENLQNGSHAEAGRRVQRSDLAELSGRAVRAGADRPGRHRRGYAAIRRATETAGYPGENRLQAIGLGKCVSCLQIKV